MERLFLALCWLLVAWILIALAIDLAPVYTRWWLRWWHGIDLDEEVKPERRDRRR